ncbi:unnamed protein product [Didymodactylos carnosus]|uniref:Uncharacterized protein n=1 Tax=Didymodactylos carnosus TaxID=1234261 RepID=A0A813WGB1_9BILA|nr:unnamed protein product [Didymodactylos carnosus]CAF0850337.1 unnamed protein product [Didymodactylos carnosus]CAF3613012.1 unnamed protein product [Didymodactylos carnosus]CAF3637973.1 unnamed protein product [Didymodactylos carnosus]
MENLDCRKIRRRRQVPYHGIEPYLGAYDPNYYLQIPQSVYYGTDGVQYQLNGNIIRYPGGLNVLEAVTQFPTPVNNLNAGFYNPQSYNAYPGGGGGYYYGNNNNMRLPSETGWYSANYVRTNIVKIPYSNSIKIKSNIFILLMLFYSYFVVHIL